MPEASTAQEAVTWWTSLRRRKVVQWGLLYAAGAWGFLQGLEYVSESFHWPDQVRQVALLALLIGLPIVLVLAWYHGDRGEQRVRGAELVIITLLLLAGGAIFWQYDRASEHSSAAPTTTNARENGPTDPRPSIAVLPFENRSRREDDAFFVDGIHDDILTQLTKVGALRVIARTSVEQFRGTNLTTREISQKLGVAKILEGGVQRAGDRVRVTVQLIDAASDTHVWAESYDRELTTANIFAIQSEVAAAIAAALRTSLTPAEQARAKQIPTQSLDAWEAYQLGQQRMVSRNSADLFEAERFFRTAIEQDPQFALAYVGLANALHLQTLYAGAPRQTTLARSGEAVERALALDPHSAEAWATAAALAGWAYEFDRAEQMFRRSIELNPNYATAQQWFAYMLERQMGRPRDALIHAEIAVTLDPLSARPNSMLARILDALGRPEAALAINAKVIRIDPLSALAYGSTGNVLADSLARLDRAIPWMEKALSLDAGNPNHLRDTVEYYRQLGDDAEASRWLTRALKDAGNTWQINETAAIESFLRGDREAGLKYARRAEVVDPYRVWLLRDDDLRKGDYATARTRYVKAHPELFHDLPVVCARNLADAIDLALVLQHTKESRRAKVLLDRADEVIRRYPRRSTGAGGVGWHMIAEISLHALRGETATALARLRAMRNSGWWLRTLAYHRDLDPNLASIRGEPEFRAIFADIERDMARQRAALATRPKDAPLELTDASKDLQQPYPQ